MTQATDTEHLAPWAQRVLALAATLTPADVRRMEREAQARAAENLARIEAEELQEDRAYWAELERQADLGEPLLQARQRLRDQGIKPPRLSPEELDAIAAAIGRRDRQEAARKRAEQEAWEADLLRRHGLDDPLQAAEEAIAGQTWTCSRKWK